MCNVSPPARARFGWLLAALGVALLVIGCGGSGSGERVEEDCPPPLSSVRGVGLSPRGMSLSGGLDPASLVAFYEEAGSHRGSAVLWNGAWRGDAVGGSDAGAAPAAARSVAVEASKRCLVAVPVFGWRAGNTPLIKTAANPTNDWTNTDARERYASMLRAFVTEFRPPYVFLGNENEFYFEQAPGDYANWVAAYNAAYDAIKAAAPETLVGPVFNYEHLAGLGALNGWTKPLWGALEAHDLAKVDVVGLSVYPFLGATAPDAIRDDYFAPLFARIGPKPVAVTETGWPAEALGGTNVPWVAGEREQVEYIGKLAALLGRHEVRLENWLLLHPLRDDGSNAQAYRLFGSVSLRNAAGEPRAAYEAWFGPP
ncbi:MAG: hypothetical protein U0446_07815 [Dehalococcoidia bacterium]